MRTLLVGAGVVALVYYFTRKSPAPAPVVAPGASAPQAPGTEPVSLPSGASTPASNYWA